MRRPLLAAAALLTAAGGGFALMLSNSPFAPPASAGAAEIELSPEVTPDIIAATRGKRAALQAEGDRAQLINAALPFSPGAIEAARPFLLRPASAADEQRALHCLTEAVYYEAGFEPVEGRRAVAQVILNRLRHPAFPKTVCGVVYEGSDRPGCQFSFTCDGSLNRRPSGPAWSAAREIARQALEGKVASTVGHATHYHANYVAPYWAPRLTKLSRIGAHIFYRWPGSWGRPAAFTGRYSGREALARMAAGDEGALLASASLPPPDPTDRRAPQDVGGRLDVTKGWTLSIPDPSKTRGHLSNVLNDQASGTAENAPLVTAGVNAS